MKFRRSKLMCGVALVTLPLLSVPLRPAIANGGDGAAGTVGAGGSGGTAASVNGEAGVEANDDSSEVTSASGGGGGATSLVSGMGGDGGTGGSAGLSGGAGGAGGTIGSNSELDNTGTISGQDGGDGQQSYLEFIPPGGPEYTGGGGGGGGGFGLAVSASNGTSHNTGTIIGGNGGAGGENEDIPSAGGGGGQGGGGVLLTNAWTFVNEGTIEGGIGGITGSLGSVSNTIPLAGAGDGGDGADLVGSLSQLINYGTIKGGAGGVTYQDGSGFGGVGVAATGGATIINGGTIIGGFDNAEQIQSDAIDLSGGGNSLVLEDGYSFTGNVVSTSGTLNGGDTLTLGGATNSTFNVSDISDFFSPSNEFTGFSKFEKIDSSTWTLTGNSYAETDWRIAGGTIAISSDRNLGITGSTVSSITLDGGALETTADILTYHDFIIGDSGGTIIPDGGTTFTIESPLTGSGDLTIAGGGTLMSMAANANTGATNIVSGTMLAGADDVFSEHSALTINSNGTADLGGFLQDIDNVTLSGGTLTDGTLNSSGGIVAHNGMISGIDGSTGLSVQSDSDLTILGENDYAGGTTIASGAYVFVGGNGNANSEIASKAGIGPIVNNGELFFRDSDFENNSIQNNGGVEFIDGSSSGNSDIVNNGYLIYGGLSNADMATINNSGIVYFAGGTGISDTDQLPSGGQAILNNISENNMPGEGVLNLTYLNVSGSSTSDEGTESTYTPSTLTLGAIEGSGQILLGNNTLTLIGNNSGSNWVYNGIIEDEDASPETPLTGGALVMDAPGSTEVLNGVNSYTGGTTIEAGTLEIGDANTPSASILGDVDVVDAGILRGHGTINGDVTNDAIVYPGGSLGTLTVNGNYIQNSDGTLVTEIAADGTSDLLAVTGSASLAGELEINVDSGNYTAGTTYSILTAAQGVTGSFANTVFNGDSALGEYLAPQFTLAGNNVELQLAPAAASPTEPSSPSTPAEPGNPATPSAPVTTVSPPALTASELTQAPAFQTGRIYAASFFAQNSGLMNILGSPSGANSSENQVENGYWMHAVGNFGNANGNNFNSKGFAIGKGFNVSPKLVVGAAISNIYSATSGGGSNVNGTSFGGLAYGIYSANRVSVSADIAAGHLSNGISRYLPGLGWHGKSSSDGGYAGAASAVQYSLVDRRHIFVSPYAQASYLYTSLGSAQESRAGILNLRYDAVHTSMAQIGAGLTGGYKLPVRYGTLTLWGSLGGFGTLGNPHASSMESLGSYRAKETALAAPEGAFTPGAGVSLAGAGPWRIAAAWGGQFGSAANVENLALQARYAW